eukprot:scaffold1296_cov74-Cyclotella_meneghiniana.AAC.2
MADSKHRDPPGHRATSPIDSNAYAARPAAITGQESSPPPAKMGPSCVQKSNQPLTIEDIYYIKYARNATI